MKQVLQDMAKGSTTLVTVPVPQLTKGQVLIDTTRSLISIGTERMLVDFGKASMIQKARQQPDRVKQVLGKMQTDGLMTTVDAVRSKLAQPLPLGYCNVGRISAVGTEVDGFEPGDRVVSNGPHADVVRVPKNLCVKIPADVSDEAAAFTVVSAIGLQGIRLAEPTLGETFVVTGVGLIGLLTVQMLRAHGCRVLAIDLDPAKLSLAETFGAETCNPGVGDDPVAAGLAFSRGVGVDGVIITASTKSSDPVTQAARMCRQRGRIVLVGVTGLELNRADFYEKELTFQVSCSYGPGRYDPLYEEEGQDYPLGFVRWTQRRNFEAVLDLMASGLMDVSPLISHRFAFEKAEDAYEVLSNDKKALGVVLEYDHAIEARHVHKVALPSTGAAKSTGPSGAVMGFVGAGNYASRMLIPAFKSAGATLHTIASSGGTSSVLHGNRSGFSNATSDTSELITDPEIDTVAIVTRHDTHARLTVDALNAGKHVFVEKPLALTLEELEMVETAHAHSGRHLMIGFNRRFAPHIQKIKSLLDSVKEPKAFIMTVNAGAIPPNHWTQDLEAGGGRIIGEACHFIDLLRYLAEAPIEAHHCLSFGEHPAVAVRDDKVTISMRFVDGSIGTIHYLANGHRSMPKERLEVFCAGRNLTLDNFRKLSGAGWPNFSRMSSWSQNKGQENCARAFVDAVRGQGPAPIPPTEIFEVTRVAIEVASAARA